MCKKQSNGFQVVAGLCFFYPFKSSFSWFFWLLDSGSFKRLAVFVALG